MGTSVPTTIYIDADACPVKDEIYRVAGRHDIPVVVVSNMPMRLPPSERIRGMIVSGDFNAADDWIAVQCGGGDVVITADIPLAARCLKKGARVLGPKGDVFTDDSIGAALAGREMMDQLRQMGAIAGGPAPRSRKDRSRFLERLENLVREARREGGTSEEGQ